LRNSTSTPHVNGQSPPCQLNHFEPGIAHLAKNQPLWHITANGGRKEKISMKLIVTKDFDYRWPSRSVTAFKADPDTVLTVKAEVAEYALANKYGKEPVADKQDKPAT
jgi:hypothetical protein